MSIKIDMTSPDLDRQIHLFQEFPEIMEKHFRNVLKVDLKLLADRILPNIPVRSGKARKTFKSRVTGKGINLTGQAGWFGAGAAWYINVVEHGAKPHEIKPRDGTVLKIGDRFVRSVQHPGFSARGFMAAGFSALQPVINEDMRVASENALRELEVK